ncbi:AI-2E family transporter [Streptococcus moroccensis]|uniref:PurR-regulated permease PerM n=1 Tax=Streptococcus moroccensis TaxID=1451356 RepID=A0ABT9YTS4_9STRE|nr:AI-2E family transporter [Streptococcus moroccensis]MDQ0222515.1 putative PurR-regulated permease PerM [Streptococcus moroccensis]
MEEGKKQKQSWFYRWFINNQTVTVLLVTLLILINIFMLNKTAFLFKPVLEFLSVIMLPLILSGLLYYLMKPGVDWLESQKIPRVWGISIVFVVVAMLIIWGLAVFIPSVQNQLISFADNLPNYVNQLDKAITDLLKDDRFAQFRPQINDILDQVTGQITEIARGFSTSAVNWVSTFVSTTSQIVVAVIIMPFILFYLLRDGHELNDTITRFMPTKWRRPVGVVLHDMNTQLSNYVRGQVTVATIVAIMFSILFSIVGLDYAVTLGVLAGVLNMVPYLGSFLAMIPALLVALIDGPSMFIKVIIVFIIEQTIEGRFVSPLIIGSSLKIHPITIMFILLTAGRMFGVWGVLLGIPVYASAKVVFEAIFKWYQAYSGLYEEVAEEEDYGITE